jgi:hypothetical protein
MPAGMNYTRTTLGLAVCQPAVLLAKGLCGCPANSRLGYGSAYVEVPFGTGSGTEIHEIQALSGPSPSGNMVVPFYANGQIPVYAQLAFTGEVLRASQIPDPALRLLAVRALEKRGNMDGASLFAVLVRSDHCRATVRAFVAFQSAYNYLDTLAEQPSESPIANGRMLHSALLVALEPDAPHPDYYAHALPGEDGGYLTAMVEVRPPPPTEFATDSAYFLWIGGPHSLLDSLVDRREDAWAGQRSLLDYYASPEEAALRIGRLARSSAEALPRGATHRVILTAMAAFYLSAAERTPKARALERAVSRELRAPVRVVLPIYRTAVHPANARFEHVPLRRSLNEHRLGSGSDDRELLRLCARVGESRWPRKPPGIRRRAAGAQPSGPSAPHADRHADPCSRWAA